MLSSEDRFAISELMARMAYCYDEGELDALEDCFCEDAVVSMRIAGGDIVGPFEGRDNVMGLYRNAKASQSDVRRHDITNLFFNTSDGAVAATSYLTLFATENGETRLLTTGVYRDQLEQRDGHWKVRRRHIDLDNGY